jgi:hypothetical protein
VAGRIGDLDLGRSDPTGILQDLNDPAIEGASEKAIGLLQESGVETGLDCFHEIFPEG